MWIGRTNGAKVGTASGFSWLAYVYDFNEAFQMSQALAKSYVPASSIATATQYTDPIVWLYSDDGKPQNRFDVGTGAATYLQPHMMQAY